MATSAVEAVQRPRMSETIRLTLPEREGLRGRVTRSRLRRTAVGVAAVWALGLLPVALGASPALKAAGLGLFFPGAGFLYTGEPLFLALTLFLFGVSFALWFGTGNIVGPVLVWLGAAGLAAASAGDQVWSWAQVAVPVGAAATVCGGLLGSRVALSRARRRAQELNRALAAVEYSVPAAPMAATLAPELLAEDLSVQRYLIDLALQPLDSFEGYDWIDQFQTSAVRYQLNYHQWALAMATYARTPAFTGYVAEAQRNLIEKFQDKRIWRYWFLENLWGYLRVDRNPIPRRDNIMLTGYIGASIGAYETTTGDERFSRPDALRFRWDDRRVYEHDFTSIAANVHENMSVNAFCLYPCEPNWIYTMCNAIGINTLITHDRLHGTEYWPEIEPHFHRGLEDEFLSIDGRLVGIRSARLGFSLPGITSTMSDALAAFWLSSSAPDVARRSYELVRRRFARLDADGELDLKLSGWDRLDVGNYRLGRDVMTACSVVLAAQEMGDADMVAAVQRHVDRTCEPQAQDGARRYAKASTLANVGLALARFGRRNGLRDLMVHGTPPEWREGPVLAEAAYPDVLVARAVSDGRGLELVLHPGHGGGRQTLSVERLRPGGRYAVQGAVASELTADDAGRASFDVDLDARREVRLVPA